MKLVPRPGSVVAHRARLDRQRPAGRHRVAGVDGEVHDHLLDLRAVGEHGRQPLVGQHRDLDVLADQPPQHRQQRGGHLAEVERDRVEDLLAGEGQELARELGGALGGALDLGQLVGARPGADPPAGDLAVAADHGQQVVEVVRHAAGELADGLHLLRLPELVLQHAALGHVAQHEQVPARQELGPRAHLEHAPAAVLLAVPDVLEHALRDPLLGQEPLPVGLRALGADQVVEPHPDELLARAPVEPARRVVDREEAPVGVEYGDNVHRRVEDRLQFGGDVIGLIGNPCHSTGHRSYTPQR